MIEMLTDMNEAVRLLVERLKTNPEDFFGALQQDSYNKSAYPKFRTVARDIEVILCVTPTEGMLRGKNATTPLWFLTDEERKALCDAYTEAKRERFTAEVFHTLLTKPESEETVKFRATGGFAQSLAASMQQTKDALARDVFTQVFTQAPIKSEGGTI